MDLQRLNTHQTRRQGRQLKTLILKLILRLMLQQQKSQKPILQWQINQIQVESSSALQLVFSKIQKILANSINASILAATSKTLCLNVLR